ncbi:MAG: AEC family transporter [Ruminococcaceae bacterium]|nr:AEC family transporter [Oscillospiraceae bacterium]
MLAMFEQVFILVTFCVIGYILCKVKLVKPDQSKVLSVVLIYILFPLMSFKTFSGQFTVAYLQEKGFLLLVSLGLIPVVVIMAKLISRLLGGEPYERNVNEHSMSMANIGYMGYPLAEAVYGTAGMLDCMMFGLPMTMYINTVGYNMLTAGNGQKSLLQKIFTPSMFGILTGCFVGITGLKLPNTVFEIAKMGSDCVAPISMMLTGMAISQFSIKELLCNKKVYVICAVRLALMPVLVWVLVKLCGFTFALLPAVLLYAMPCGMNTIVFPKLVDKDCRLGAATVLISTIVSMVTIPICLYFLL